MKFLDRLFRASLERSDALQIKALERFRDECITGLPARTPYDQGYCLGGIQRAEEWISRLQEGK